MIIIGSNTQNENTVSGQIQIQIDSLQSAIDEINADIDTLSQTLTTLQTSVNAQIDSETQTLLSTLNSQMSDLRASLESAVSTNQITAVIGNIQQLAVTVSATINALTAGSINATTGITTANLTSVSSDIGNAQAASLSTGSLDATVATLGTVSASVLNVVTFIIENLTATNFSATNGAITNFETSLIKADTITGKQWHTPVSLPDNTELLRVRIPAYDGIITFISEDGEVNVTIINNASISYNQNVQYLYRIDSKTDYVDLYLSNIDDTINYQVIYLGEGEHGIVTSEIVDKTGIQQNIETLKGITSISSKELNVELIFVQLLPEVGRENVIYLIETEGAFIWNEQEDKYYCFAGTVYQRKVLTDSVTIDEVEQTTVEGAIGALATLANSNKSLKQDKILSTPVTANGITATTVEGAIDALNAENKIVDGTLEVEEETYLDSDVVAEKNVTVKGNLIVNGTTYTTEEVSLNTKADYVVLRENNPSGLGANEKSGIVIHNYSSNKSASLGVDKDGIFRISDNASEATTTYTNVSQFNGSYYSGLTQTTTQVISSGAVVAQDEDVLSDCVYYNGAYYHRSDKWFSVSLVSNVLTVGSEVTDETTLATLEQLTKYELFYYRTLSVLTVQDSTNQPVMTRAEANVLTDKTLLMWSASENKAVEIDEQPTGGDVLSTETSTVYSSNFIAVRKAVGNAYFRASNVCSSWEDLETASYDDGTATFIKPVEEGYSASSSIANLADLYFDYDSDQTLFYVLENNEYYKVLGLDANDDYILDSNPTALSSPWRVGNAYALFCLYRSFREENSYKWKGVDPTPIADSSNLVESGGVNSRLAAIEAVMSAQAIFDIVHPVGEVYVQYPQQDPPATIYNKSGITSTWTVIDYDGAFFRAQGGNAIAFSEKGSSLSTQADSVKEHQHTINHTHSGTTGSCRALANGEQRWEGWFSAAEGGQGHSEFTAGGNMWVSDNTARTYPSATGSGNGHRQVNINVDHRHDFTTSSQSLTESGWYGSGETRPMNYTIRVWKRTA